MEVNRNQWFLAGLVLLILGIEFRLVDSFVLTRECAQLLAEGTGNRAMADTTTSTLFRPLQNIPAAKTVTPPEWLGWCLLSVGMVLTLHSFAMKRPE